LFFRFAVIVLSSPKPVYRHAIGYHFPRKGCGVSAAVECGSSSSSIALSLTPFRNHRFPRLFQQPARQRGSYSMKPVKYQHEIDAELEKRSGIKGLKLIRLKGYDPSWDVGGLREKPLDAASEAKLRETVTEMQNEIDMA
jgi:hypothetical protein